MDAGGTHFFLPPLDVAFALSSLSLVHASIQRVSGNRIFIFSPRVQREYPLTEYAESAFARLRAIAGKRGLISAGSMARDKRRNALELNAISANYVKRPRYIDDDT